MFCDQTRFAVRCEWGLRGVQALAPHSAVVIVVDVLSFSTCVDVATGRGAAVLPYRWQDASAADHARGRGAELASFERRSAGFSLAPSSLVAIPAGTRLVLPSPNGSEQSLAAAETGAVLAGCLRNARSVAAAARDLGRSIAVIPCGERWDDGSLRPALEDWIGAGAILAHLGEDLSPEARAARAAFEACRDRLQETVLACASGRELVERGFAADVELAAALDVSSGAPRLVAGEFRA
jgi:2-phosphosulfolactate phosphatase